MRVQGNSSTLTFLSQYSTASTTEGTLMELGHKIRRNLENIVEEIIKYLKSLFPHASEVMKP